MTRVTTVLLAILLTSCSFSSSSGPIGDLVADNSDLETCGPIWVDAVDPVNLVWVLQYGPPTNLEAEFVGSAVEWSEVEYDTSVAMAIDTYAMRAVGMDAVDDMMSRTFLGGVVEYAEIAPLIEEYGTLLPARYVSEPGEGVVLLGVARSAAPEPGSQVSYQPTKVRFTIDGVPGTVVPPERVARAEGLSVPRQDPTDLDYCN